MLPMPRRRPSSSLEPRFELTPLLDVIFLLLTFFIYSLVLMVRAEVLPVELPKLEAGKSPKAGAVAGITVGPNNQLYLNRQRVTFDELKRRLKDRVGQAESPQVFVALSKETAKTDRGPTLIRVIDMLRRIGVENFSIVGRSGS